MVGAGGAVVAAATGSQPDQLLYPVKLGFEQAQLAMVLTPVKEGLRLQQAETRAMEIAYLAGKGEAGLIESVAKNMETALTGQSANGLSMQPTLPPARSMSPEPSASTPFPAPLVAPQAPAQVVAPTPDKVPFSTQPPNSTPPAAVSPPSAAAPGKAAVSAVKPAEDGDKYKDKENNMVLASQRRTIQTLEEALKKSSPDAKPALEKALERAKKAYDQAFDRNRDDNDGKNRDSRH
jgi:hypothetical protein